MTDKRDDAIKELRWNPNVYNVVVSAYTRFDCIINQIVQIKCMEKKCLKKERVESFHSTVHHSNGYSYNLMNK